jgi:hypothetical protein
MSKPTIIDEEFEREARAMARAMDTGELPPEDASYYRRVKALAELHWGKKEKRLTNRGGRS